MKIALVGNQNSGKTTLFNLLTGTNQKVGNWPGVTIERKEGIVKNNPDLKIVDLPGIYSLSPYTLEEDISRKYVLEEQIDVIVNIIDSTSLERSLYLTTQLLELNTKVIIVLNMEDILEKKGIFIDHNKLEKELNTSIVRISALKNTGINELINLLKNNEIKENNHKKIYSEEIEKLIEEISPSISNHQRFISVKTIEKDTLANKYLNSDLENKILNIERQYGTDMEEIIASQRYDFIEKVKNITVSAKEKKETITDKLDKIFLNKYLALPIFGLIMFLIYYLSVGVIGSATVDFVDGIVSTIKDSVSSWLDNINASNWMISLICDGIISGVGAVLNFVPQLIILFISIAILETSGYMNRIAFFLDLLFKKFGLSGKSLIPFIVGSGCSVPGVMAARTVEDDKERKMTVILTPFIPCSAKLPIIALFAGYFFPKNSGLISFSLYIMAIVIILISALVMKKYIFKGNNSTFISELPEYKLPSAKYIFRDVLEKTASFFKRAGTIILLCSVVIWFLASFNLKFQYLSGDSIETSILANIGKLFSWIFYPMLGEFNWAATVSAFQGLVAKEQVVGSMAVIAGFAEDLEDTNLIFGSSLFSGMTASSAYAFMVFNLFSAPCFGAIGAMKKELGSTKSMLKAVLFQTAIAWVLGVIVYNVGNLLCIIF